MKKMIIAIIVGTLAFIFTAPSQSKQVKTKKFYSLDKYDGSHCPSPKLNGKYSAIYDDPVLSIIFGNSNAINYAWVTFELHDSDLTNAKIAKLKLYEKTREHETTIMSEFKEFLYFITVPKEDYQYWKNGYVPKFLPANNSIYPKACKLNRYPSNKFLAVSDNILPELKILKKENHYITLQIVVSATVNGHISYYSGHTKNNIYRPHLEISY